MASPTHTNGSTGSITLKSFSELASVLDLDSLPPGPADTDDETTARTDSLLETTSADPVSPLTDEQASTAPQLDLASVIAQLAHVSSDLENTARSDARAREQATLELARYETLAAERAEAERALVEARRVRTAAELLASQAFTDEARVEAARAVALSRQAEMACTALVAERTRAADELASRPYLASIVADRRRREQAEAEAQRRAEEERAARLTDGIAAARQALHRGDLDQARALLAPLARDFPSNDQVQSVLDIVRWQAQQLVIGPAQEALREVRGRAGREDPEWAVGRLSALAVDGLPESVARQVFGVWSNACWSLVQRRGWHAPTRYSAATSRGAVLARREPDGPTEIVSALGMGPGWRVGEVVTDPRILRAARPLQPR